MEEVASDTARGRAGAVLRGKWQLGPIIGSGGTAMVYEGTHRSNGKRVAVKVLHRILASSDDTVARFRREGFVANLVGHPGTVAIFDDDTTEDGIPFLVMDRLDGEPLTRVLERAGIDGVGGALEPARVLAIADDVLDVLAAAHAKGIIHRDVKPDNVFIARGGRAMLLDFGIARVEGDAARRDPAHRLSPQPVPPLLAGDRVMTLDGSTLGTPKYMAPEQARGRWSEVDGRSDLWALGATMFRALAGCGVRTAPNTSEVLLQAMTERAPRLADVAPHIAPEIAAIVDRALSLEKEDRWPDARAMQEAIRVAAPRAGDAHDEARAVVTLAPIHTPSAPVPTPSRSTPAWLAAGTLAFVAFAAVIAWRPLGRTEGHAAPSASAAGAPLDTSPSVSAPAETASPDPEPTAASTSAAPADSIPTLDLNALPLVPPVRHHHPRPHPAASASSDSVAPPSASDVPPSPSPLERRH